MLETIRVLGLSRGEHVIDRILKNGHTAEANLLMGQAQFAAGDYKAALGTLRKAVDLNPHLPGAWSLYGRALVEGHDNAAAEAAFRRALQIDSNDFSANLHLGAILRFNGNNAEAAPYLEKSFRLRPNSPQALFRLVHCVLRRAGSSKPERYWTGWKKPGPISWTCMFNSLLFIRAWALSQRASASAIVSSS